MGCQGEYRGGYLFVIVGEGDFRVRGDLKSIVVTSVVDVMTEAAEEEGQLLEVGE